MLTVTPLHPLFAARIVGLDLGRSAVGDGDFATIREAFERYSVLVFPSQDIDDDRQIAFSERFGPLETTKIGTSGAGSKLVILSNIAPDGGIVPPTDRQILSNKANRLWHADSSFKPIPALASMLSARQIPASGGADTEFVSMRAVYAELPDELKQAVEGKVAIHDYAYSRGKIDPDLMTAAERAALPPVRQAMVLDHGRHGRSLYVGSHAARIERMSETAGRELLDRLLAFATQPRFIYRHPWADHDLVLWRNRAVIHRATPFRNAEERRHMVRTTIAGAAPTLAAPAGNKEPGK
jgi:alpha-ketoglutarate-dependent 2,4-dichlorophenoxyacetate dioxygenase